MKHIVPNAEQKTLELFDSCFDLIEQYITPLVLPVCINSAVCVMQSKVTDLRIELCLLEEPGYGAAIAQSAIWWGLNGENRTPATQAAAIELVVDHIPAMQSYDDQMLLDPESIEVLSIFQPYAQGRPIVKESWRASEAMLVMRNAVPITKPTTTGLFGQKNQVGWHLRYGCCQCAPAHLNGTL